MAPAPGAAPAAARAPEIFVAVDTPALGPAKDLGRALAGRVEGLKLGLEFFVAKGPAGVRAMAGLGLPIFLDLKLHDIPNTVAGAVRSAAALAPALLTLHAAGGPAMLRAARDAAAEAPQPPRLVAVTVLTSLDEGDLAATGQRGPALDQVRRLAGLAQQAGLAGVVCSPLEIAPLRADCGPDFLLVVPGIRPAGAASGDQKRVMTPAEAAAAGASVLVVGRPITGAADPPAAAAAIRAELAGAAP
ncbi:MAG: orotidine-5'-phosphate decarboxylase [Dongiaceae bacterium]